MTTETAATAPRPDRPHRPELPGTLPGALREFARHASPRILAALALGFAAARLAVGAFSPWDLLSAAAVVVLWPVQEWLVHVGILHYRPRRVAGRTLDFLVPRKHRAHHRDPWRLDLVFIPLQVYLGVPALLALVLWLAAASLPAALGALAVYFALSLNYEWIHFLIHTRYPPRRALYRRVWRNHLLHHFKNENYWYGVTMLGGDRLFGTAADPERVPTSATARTLGVEPVH
jgi:sterol desaturase/sphingolipid hydroxylase (fatty acid hydroxylase superfamily)